MNLPKPIYYFVEEKSHLLLHSQSLLSSPNVLESLSIRAPMFLELSCPAVYAITKETHLNDLALHQGKDCQWY